MFKTVCNLSTPKLPKTHDQQLLMIRSRSCSECGSLRVSVQFDYSGGQYIDIKPWCANVNSLRLSGAYPNGNIYVKPETQNRRLELTGQAKGGEIRRAIGTCPGMPHADSTGRVFGWVWNLTDPFWQSKSGPTCCSSLNPDRWRGTRTRCQSYITATQSPFNYIMYKN